MDLIEEIKTSISIIEAFKQYTDVNLSKSKVNRKQFNICCPWHDDKNPSLTIYTHSNTWKCWSGCGGGDVINLVSKSKNLSNEEAIKLLLKDLNISPQYLKQDRNPESYRINEGLKEFNQYCKLYADELETLKLILCDTARTITTVEEMEQKGGIYHTLARIEYLSPLVKYGSVSDRIYAIRQIGEMINHEGC